MQTNYLPHKSIFVMYTILVGWSLPSLSHSLNYIYLPTVDFQQIYYVSETSLYIIHKNIIMILKINKQISNISV